ncbi:hypothetical protein ACFP3Q_11420 [Nocardioides sp. GCM10027113]|uniref:hypothetical protein n=1 Tax=unclassified Nocardioides TaxID=2615069 RepID=UPI00361129FB
MYLSNELNRMRQQTAPHDADRLAALDKLHALSILPGHQAGDLWGALNDAERDAVADFLEDDACPWTEDEGSCDGEGW